MPIVKAESIEDIRNGVSIIDVVRDFVELKSAGSVYKALCPFHEEKSPSFIINKGSNYYHCFGCGAHGDSIQFVMNHLQMTFGEAVEFVANKYGISIKYEESKKDRYSHKVAKLALEEASKFYHFCLLHTEEGHFALKYLYGRGLDIPFVKKFHLGYSMKSGYSFFKYMHAKNFDDNELEEVGLIKRLNDKCVQAFSQRITFPIKNSLGHIVGFSARKFDEKTFGGKYVNTAETPLFKKSKILYGIDECRKSIIKKKRVLVVEGQIDALRLIDNGWDITVAPLGTAFSEHHAEECLKLGVQQAFLAFDGDNAGQEALKKTGDILQKRGIETFAIPILPKSDPDKLLNIGGRDMFQKAIDDKIPYVEFLVAYFKKKYNENSPSQKSKIVEEISQQIKWWESPILVRESLKMLSSILQIPEEMVIPRNFHHSHISQIKTRNIGNVKFQEINATKTLEIECLRWLFLCEKNFEEILDIAKKNLLPEYFSMPICRTIYENIVNNDNKIPNLMKFVSDISDPEANAIFGEIIKRRVNVENCKELFQKIVTNMKNAHNIRSRDEILKKIHSRQYSEEEEKKLVEQFDALTKDYNK